MKRKEQKMKNSKLLTMIVLAVFVLAPLSVSMAKEQPVYKIYKVEGKSYEKYDKGQKDGDSLKHKFFKTARFYLKKKDKIGLSDEQVKQIIDLKVATKKDLITKKAEIKIAKLDVKVALKQKPIDVDAVKKFISKKYELKKQKALNLAEAYVKLKAVLNDSQRAKAKEIWIECKQKKN